MTINQSLPYYWLRNVLLNINSSLRGLWIAGPSFSPAGLLATSPEWLAESSTARSWWTTMRMKWYSIHAWRHADKPGRCYVRPVSTDVAQSVWAESMQRDSRSRQQALHRLYGSKETLSGGWRIYAIRLCPQISVRANALCCEGTPAEQQPSQASKKARRKVERCNVETCG